MPSERNLLPRSELKILFEYILDLREKTDPDLGPDSAKNKNYNAQQALIFGGLLFDSLIGWAANHQIGAITEDLLSEDRLRRQGLIDPAPVRRLWQRPRPGQRAWQKRIWCVLMLQAWLEHDRAAARQLADPTPPSPSTGQTA